MFQSKKMGHYANECMSQKDSSGSEKHVTFAMIEKGEEENMQESKNPTFAVMHQRRFYDWNHE